MNTKIFIAVICFFVAATFISFSIFRDLNGPHGGILKNAGNYKIEMKDELSEINVYLLDERLKTVGGKGLSCEVRFFFRDNTSIDVQLIPNDNEGFSGKPGTQFSSCLVTFDLAGKKVSALFESEVIVVKEE